MITYKVCSKCNTSYFIMLAHKVRVRSCWDGRKGWSKIPTSVSLHFVAMWQMAAICKMAHDVEVCMKKSYGIKFLHAKKMSHSDIHWCLLNISGDQIVDVSTVRWLLVCFKWNSSGNIELWRLFPIKIKFHTTVQYPYFNNQVLKFLHIGNN